MERRLERVLTTDPGMGVIRHAEAGYEEAGRFAESTASSGQRDFMATNEHE